MARFNPYAHVVIYIGPKEGEGDDLEYHQVVHVRKANRKGLVMGKIRKEDITKVIKPHNFVFIGHGIEANQSSGNVEEKISESALKCARKPTIVFDYDHR